MNYIKNNLARISERFWCVLFCVYTSLIFIFLLLGQFAQDDRIIIHRIDKLLPYKLWIIFFLLILGHPYVVCLLSIVGVQFSKQQSELSSALSKPPSSANLIKKHDIAIWIAVFILLLVIFPSLLKLRESALAANVIILIILLSFILTAVFSPRFKTITQYPEHTRRNLLVMYYILWIPYILSLLILLPSFLPHSPRDSSGLMGIYGIFLFSLPIGLLWSMLLILRSILRYGFRKMSVALGIILLSNFAFLSITFKLVH
ncbi:hypothetical protein HY285_02460 [Candidatus Peregrinibacteria bacterium]|nr:hypothetical protein [Candidatus Peregrinibacteria bacterium]MBI3816383.1 hypothetical protein [Candidatus Peregrinibacteria bacterium]